MQHRQIVLRRSMKEGRHPAVSIIPFRHYSAQFSRQTRQQRTAATNGVHNNQPSRRRRERPSDASAPTDGRAQRQTASAQRGLRVHRPGRQRGSAGVAGESLNTKLETELEAKTTAKVEGLLGLGGVMGRLCFRVSGKTKALFTSSGTRLKNRVRPQNDHSDGTFGYD